MTSSLSGTGSDTLFPCASLGKGDERLKVIGEGLEEASPTPLRFLFYKRRFYYAGGEQSLGITTEQGKGLDPLPQQQPEHPLEGSDRTGTARWFQGWVQE